MVPAPKKGKEGLSQVHPQSWVSVAGAVTLSSGPIGPTPHRATSPEEETYLPAGGELPVPPGPADHYLGDQALRCVPLGSMSGVPLSLRKASPHPP